MSDVTTSVVGDNDFGGGAQEVPQATVFPGYSGQTWQGYQSGDDLVGDEPTVNAAPGHVSNGIRVAQPEAADPFPGMRPDGWEAGYMAGTPSWAMDSPGDGMDYDAAPDPFLSSPGRPWQSSTRPSDTGFTDAFPGGGQIVPGVPDTTGTTGPRRLRADNSAPGVQP